MISLPKRHRHLIRHSLIKTPQLFPIRDSHKSQIPLNEMPICIERTISRWHVFVHSQNNNKLKWLFESHQKSGNSKKKKIRREKTEPKVITLFVYLLILWRNNSFNLYQIQQKKKLSWSITKYAQALLYTCIIYVSISTQIAHTNTHIYIRVHKYSTKNLVHLIQLISRVGACVRDGGIHHHRRQILNIFPL